MKMTRKILSLLLALVLVLALTACDGLNIAGKTGSEIVGEWVMEMDLAEATNEMMLAEIPDESLLPSAEFPAHMTLELKSSGKCAITIEVQAEDYMDELADNMVDYIYDMYAQNGMSKAEVDQAYEAETGSSIREECDNSIKAALEELEENMADASMEGYYKYDDGKLYFAEDEDELEDKENYMVISLDDDELTVKKMVGDDLEDMPEEMEELGLELPWTFEKQ